MNSVARSGSSTTETMTPEEERLYKVLGMEPPKPKHPIASLIGAILGFLLGIAVYGCSFVYAFNLTLPQGLVLGWVLMQLLDSIRNGQKR
jgi:hypothetical protein